MIVCFRVDSSYQLGAGHIMRCLTLADEHSQRGSAVMFICRDLPGNLISLIEKRGYKIYRLPNSHLPNYVDDSVNNDQKVQGLSWVTDAMQTLDVIKESGQLPDLLIVDHYALDYKWENMIKDVVPIIVVIDDLADRYHECEMIIDQNYYDCYDKRYDALTRENCIKLLGPQYAILRPEFAETRKTKICDQESKRILVFLGGTDITNETEKVIYALNKLEHPDVVTDVIVGATNPHKESIRSICNSMPNMNYYCQIEHIEFLMIKSDLAIGAGGTNTWERCCLGLPAVVVIIAKNQEQVVNKMAKEGLLISCGSAGQDYGALLTQQINRLLSNQKVIEEMSLRGMNLIDGKGCQRVVDQIFVNFLVKE
jgi:UDP-2,4-diacetamido-2,4,6-trideoxy-beta-L-altropyranose hydrolase